MADAPAGPSGDTNDGTRRRKGKPRNKYKLYECDLNARPPRQTVRSRQLRRENERLDLQERVAPDNEQHCPLNNAGVEQPPITYQPAVTASGLLDVFTEGPIDEHGNNALVGIQQLPATQEESDGNGAVQEDRIQVEDVHYLEQQLPQEETQEQEICVGLCVCGNCVNQNEIHMDVEANQHEGLDVAPEVDEVDKDRGRKNTYEWMNDSLHLSVSTTKFEAFLMVLHLCMRHGMTGPLVLDILKMINALFGINVVPESEYIFKQLFSPTCSLQYHFYCPDCELYLGEKSSFIVNLVICKMCETEYNTKLLHDYGDNYFVTLSIRHQLEELLKNPDIDIVPHLDRPTDAIRDFMDGEMYKKLCAAGQPLSNPHSLSGIFNTDGAPVWHSSKGSIWPLQLLVNEVSPKDRLRPENVLMLGIWFGKGAPNMSVFLQPFISELQELSVNGVRRVMADGMEVRCPFFALACTVDSVAKPKLQALKQFNGHFGCGYCYHPNTALPEAGGQSCYVADRVYPLRSHIEMVEDMCTADALRKLGQLKRVKATAGRQETWDDVNGLKGISCLLNIPYFDTVFGYTIDYMHNILAGVAKKCAELLFDSSQEVPYSISKHIQLVDARMKAITLPHSMTRAPRALSERSFWKCIEWRSFLLFFCLPCLEDILPQKYFDNLKDLVMSIHILLKDCITPTDLAEADQRLQNFVTDFNKYYGNVNMVYNIHLCSHLVHMVRMWGPLWATSTFPFESGNGALLRLIKGTRGVVSQISQKYATVQSVRKYVQDFTVSDRIIDICNDICSYSPLKNSKSFGEATSLGLEKCSRISEEEVQAFRNQANLPVPPNDYLVYYNRVVRDSIVFYSKAYTRPTTNNDTCVELESCTYAVIQKILPIPTNGHVELWALINPLRISQGSHLAPHIMTCSADLYAPLELIQFHKVVRKCIFFNVRNRNYVCRIPNIYERN